MVILKTILFDLDNTIINDSRAIKMAFTKLKERYSFFKNMPVNKLISDFYNCDYDTIGLIRSGKIGIQEAFPRKVELFLKEERLNLDEQVVDYIGEHIRETHIDCCRLFSGTERLLSLLKGEYRILVITNFIGEYQKEKISKLGIAKYIDDVIPSYDFSFAKPQREIFEIAIERSGCASSEAVMIGDDWNADIKGAFSVGIIPIWVNFKNDPAPSRDFKNIIRTYEPAYEIKKKIEEFHSIGIERVHL